jgi:acetyltransferase-like isoleucine patch superfamily enzyme
MKTLGSLLEWTIRSLKNDPAYALKTELTTRQSLYVLVYRMIQAIRGSIVRLRFHSSDGLIFCGRRVIVEHGYQIRCGAGLILEDGVHINALSKEGITFGRNVTIGKDSILASTGVVANLGVGINIGDYSAVGAQSFIGGQGGVTLGNDVIMGPGVRIFSENHVYSSRDRKIRQQGESRQGVCIEDDCWIGANVIVVDGARIGRGSVVAAGAVVTKGCPPGSVLAGVPARVIKRR